MRSLVGLMSLVLLASMSPASPALRVRAASAAPAPGPSVTSSIALTAARVRDRALAGESPAWDFLVSLTSEIGARPTGSKAMERARDWSVARLTKLGFSNVKVEPFTKKRAWQRGPESAVITSPAEHQQALQILGLGNSPASPAGGVEGEVVVFDSLEGLKLAPPGSLAGKIAVVNQPMVRTQTGEGYGAAVKARGAGPIAAAKGAVAYLTRSIATGDARAPHTGAMGWGNEGAGHIPCAALGIADADRLARLAAKGPVRVRLDMQPTVVVDAPAWNISGEVRGRDPKAGVIVIGGHLDSWDPGQGAQDDGAGMAITVGAAKLIADLPLSQRPRRTVRVVLFGSEETGGSDDAYLAAHKDEVPQIAMAAESDSGSGRVYRVALPANAAADPALAGLATVLAPLRVFIASDASRHAGSDMESLQEAGVPIVEMSTDASHYFDVHHSADDTLDKVDRAALEQATATWAAVLYFMAESGVDLRHPPAPPPKQ